MAALRVLITNMVLLGRSGTETYVRDLAVALRQRGHHPEVYSPRTGKISREIRAAGIPVRERLSELTDRPDIIHGHHNLPTMSVLLRFPGVPAVFVCHSRGFWADAPPAFPRIRRYVAVDDLCRERLLSEHAIPERLVRVVPNSVDLGRFKPRGPLPDRPRRALLFSNYANEHTHLPVVREACARMGLALDVIGSGVHNVCDHPETVLGGFDIVFAKARCALEAMAVGAAVVLCGVEGTGPLVRSDDFTALRRLNFGRGTLIDPVTADKLVAEVKRYDPGDAARVSARVRAEAGLDLMVTELLATYRDALDDPTNGDHDIAAAEALATAEYLQALEPPLFAFFAADDKIMHLEAEVRRLASELAGFGAERKPPASRWSVRELLGLGRSGPD